MAALVGTVQTPVVSQFFGSRPLGPVGWGIVLGAATSAAALGVIPARHLQGLTRVMERVSTAGARLARRREATR
jgi:cation-transporting ATPase I